MKTHHYIIVTLAINKVNEDGKDVWLAECEELGTSTFGDSFEEVEKEIKDLVVLHLNTLEKLGSREQFFIDNNIKLYTKIIPKTHRVETQINPNAFVSTYAQELAIN